LKVLESAPAKTDPKTATAMMMVKVSFFAMYFWFYLLLASRGDRR